MYLLISFRLFLIGICILASVRVLGECTTFINVHNVVKQGKGAFYYQFSIIYIYVNDLMKLLMKANLGSFIGGYFFWSVILCG